MITAATGLVRVFNEGVVTATKRQNPFVKNVTLPCSLSVSKYFIKKSFTLRCMCIKIFNQILHFETAFTRTTIFVNFLLTDSCLLTGTTLQFIISSCATIYQNKSELYFIVGTINLCQVIRILTKICLYIHFSKYKFAVQILLLLILHVSQLHIVLEKQFSWL